MTGQQASAAVRRPDYIGSHEDQLEGIREKVRTGDTVLLIAGFSQHGKTTLAERLLQHYSESAYPTALPGSTTGTVANLYRIGDRTSVSDMAGEYFQNLATYGPEEVPVMDNYLWKGLQLFGGLILLIDLTLATNETDRDAGQLVRQSHQRLLTHAIVAHNRKNRTHLDRLSKTEELSASAKPLSQYDRIERVVAKLRKQGKLAPKRMYARPVSLVFSRADRYHKEINIDPRKEDPLTVAKDKFPQFHHWLERHVRYFRWSFCQAIENPEPANMETANDDPSTLIGAEGILTFHNHYWSWPWPFRSRMSTAKALREHEK